MLDPTAICQLYASVLNENIISNKIPEHRIRAGIQSMNYAYSSNGAKLTSTECSTPNFNEPAFRCAYLHKYAPLHTYIVRDVMLRILRQEAGNHFQNLLNAGEFDLCCLGGGPGTDVLGILAALYIEFKSSFNSSSVTVIDCKRGWEATFISLIRKLRIESYSNIWNFHWRYVEADMLQGMTDEANMYIGSATLVTMIKFVSAASCTKAEQMVERIFEVMKPGGFVLYIDNGAGGYTQVVERASKRYGFKNVMPPLRHLKYENENFRSLKFGYTSCFKTTVTVILLKKPFSTNQTKIIAPATLYLPKFSNTYKFPMKPSPPICFSATRVSSSATRVSSSATRVSPSATRDSSSTTRLNNKGFLSKKFLNHVEESAKEAIVLLFLKCLHITYVFFKENL